MARTNPWPKKSDKSTPTDKVELEKDAEDDEREQLQASAGFLLHDTTLNVMMPAAGGHVLMALSDPSFHQLFASARANIGLTGGRYFFEVAILECRSSSSAEPIVRLGFAHASARVPLLDTEDDGMACFDWEGNFTCDGQRKRVTQRFQRGDIAAVVLNLDASSPNGHTVSLYRNGVRASPPQAIPEALYGQALYPAVSFVGATLRVNLEGPFLRPPPFRCRAVQEAAVQDCQVSEAPAPPQDGKRELLLPVGLPDEGIREWINQFLEDHKGYCELSRRSVLQWATRSGVWVKSEGLHRDPSLSNGADDLNKPEHQSLQLEEASIPDLLGSLSPLGLRNFVVAEVVENLTASGRKATLDRYSSDEYKKIAIVVMGQPPEEYKEKMKAEAKLAQLAAAINNAKDNSLLPKEGEAEDISKVFTSFSLPETSEGFDEIRFEWQPLKECQEHLVVWKRRCKLTQRIEDLQPSKWFSKKWSEWQKAYQGWKRKQDEWKEVIKVLDQWKDEGSKQDADAGKAKAKEKDDRPTETIAEDLEVFEVQDVNDTGEGEPLCSNFEYEDWCLLSLRYELHLLVHAFRRDVADPERTSFHMKHLEFYYELYYKKALDMSVYAVSSVGGLVELVDESAELDANSGILQCKLEETTPLDKFVKFAEAHRRDRARRLDAGDETAGLTFPKPAGQQPAGKAQNQKAKDSKLAPSGHDSGIPRITTPRPPQAPPPVGLQGLKRPVPVGGYGPLKAFRRLR